MQKLYFSDKYIINSHKVLATGLETASVYRSWLELDRRDLSLDERYAALPVLTKNDIRNHFPDGLVPEGRSIGDGIAKGEISFVDTSGTTSEKITNIWNQPWWNDSEAASWTLNAHTAHLNHNAREAQLASSLNVGFCSSGILPMQDRILNGRILFLNEKASALEWDNDIYARMARELTEFRPAILEANPSLLARLSWWAIDNSVSMYLPQIILFTYEFPSQIHRKDIRKAFPVPSASSYGTTETGYVFMQCEHGTYHQNTDFCRVDFQPLKNMHGGPDKGRILVTIFNNKWTSLIKFDVGDIVSLSDHSCPCGRNEGYILESIEGRTANATFATAGNLVTTKQLDDALLKTDGIRDYHLDQFSRNEYSLKIMTGGNPAGLTDNIKKQMRLLYGSDAELNIDFCKDIAPAASGKYRRTQAHFEFDPKELFN
ncbi:MAG: hypothetical protein V1874_10890 [Spirochaetota bacterium]